MRNPNPAFDWERFNSLSKTQSPCLPPIFDKCPNYVGLGALSKHQMMFVQTCHTVYEFQCYWCDVRWFTSKSDFWPKP